MVKTNRIFGGSLVTKILFFGSYNRKSCKIVRYYKKLLYIKISNFSMLSVLSFSLLWSVYTVYIFLILFVCVTALFISLWHDRYSRPVWLESVWPEGCPSKNNFPERWPVAKLLTEKNVPPVLFYVINWAQFVFMFETQSYCESEVPNADVTLF